MRRRENRRCSPGAAETVPVRCRLRQL